MLVWLLWLQICGWPVWRSCLYFILCDGWWVRYLFWLLRGCLRVRVDRDRDGSNLPSCWWLCSRWWNRCSGWCRCCCRWVIFSFGWVLVLWGRTRWVAVCRVVRIVVGKGWVCGGSLWRWCFWACWWCFFWIRGRWVWNRVAGSDNSRLL